MVPRCRCEPQAREVQVAAGPFKVKSRHSSLAIRNLLRCWLNWQKATSPRQARLGMLGEAELATD
eukprot:34032-Lingulodinium_polyedra.AAC.1